MSAGQTRQKSTKKRSLRFVNEHFEAIFDAVWPNAIVNQRFLNNDADCQRWADEQEMTENHHPAQYVGEVRSVQ